MNRTTHRITACTPYRHTGQAGCPGHDLIAPLRAAIARPRRRRVGDVRGVRPGPHGGLRPVLHGRLQLSSKATDLFGDIDAAQDITDLITFARQYRALDDSCCASTTRPGKVRRATLGRVPAAVIAIEAGAVR
jgi:hypothetical protein